MDSIFADGSAEVATGVRVASSDEYHQVVERSGLVTPAELSKAMEAFRIVATRRGNDAATLSFFLLQRKLLTPWQTKMLLQGRCQGFILGKYKLLDRIGVGGMGSVYLAEHLMMRRQVAIKVLPRAQNDNDGRLHRFLAESRAAAQLDHPNIVRAYHFDVEYDRYYLVMEYVDGYTLQQKVEREGPPPFRTAAEYVRQAAEGLAHAHSASLIHRDMKPANLLVDRTETVKLLDLGLAHNIDSESVSLTNDRSGKVLGTADYVAPEQVRDSHDVDARTDIYGLGGTFYFLLTGSVPYPEGNLAHKLAMHLYNQPAPIRDRRPDCPEVLDQICMKMMAKQREDRFQTAAEVSEALQHWLETGNLQAHVRIPAQASVDTLAAQDTKKSLPPIAASAAAATAIGTTAPTNSGHAASSSISKSGNVSSGNSTAPGGASAIEDPGLTSSGSSPQISATSATDIVALKMPGAGGSSENNPAEGVLENDTSPKRRKRPKRRTESTRFHPIMTLEEVAEYLRLPADSLLRLAQDGKLPCQQIAGEWRFHKKAIDQWLNDTNFGSPTWMQLMPKLGWEQSSGSSMSIAGLTREQFEQCMESGGLLQGAEGERRKHALKKHAAASTADVSRLLVDEGLLTDYQSALLVRGETERLAFGDYIVQEKIGSGGMAVVYKAKHAVKQQIVALKVLTHTEGRNSEEESRRFDREVRAVAKLNHPNIVMAIDAVHREKESYLVMEYVDGPNLDELVRRKGPLEVGRAVDYILQAARGFAHAHAKHLVHRDIKPGNLLLTSTDVVKILDLGLVRFESASWSHRNGQEQQDRLTKSETVLGTPDFMAPEQFLDPREADNRADIYGLGCTLFFLLTGRAPFEQSSPTRVFRAHQTDPIPDLRKVRQEVPPSLQRVFEKMLQKNPAHRYGQMNDIVSDLEEFVIPDLAEKTLNEAPSTVAGSVSKPRKGLLEKKVELKPKKTRRPLATSELVLVMSLGILIGGVAGYLCWFAELALAMKLAEFLKDSNAPLHPGALCATIGATIGVAVAFILVELMRE